MATRTRPAVAICRNETSPIPIYRFLYGSDLEKRSANFLLFTFLLFECTVFIGFFLNVFFIKSLNGNGIDGVDSIVSILFVAIRFGGNGSGLVVRFPDHSPFLGQLLLPVANVHLRRGGHFRR